MQEKRHDCVVEMRLCFFLGKVGDYNVSFVETRMCRSTKERLGHEKIQTTLGTYGHLYPNTNLEVANKLTGILHYTPASQSVANYTSNQHTAIYHREVD